LTPAEIAESCGLTGYSCDGSGIGGLLKTRAEDFRVDEVSTPPAMQGKGRFTVARVTLNNWETNRFIGQLAKRLRISRNRIWFSGTKDKRAITSQLLTIDAHENKVAGVSMSDVEIEVLGRTHQKLHLGDHDGNRFTITVRGCVDSDGSPLDAKTAIERVNAAQAGMEQRLGVGRFPNWVGPQRFGATRPVTPVVGRAILSDDYEGAVNAYLGMPGINQVDDVGQFRSEWAENKNVEAALEIIPKQLGFERDMLSHLKSKPDDWTGAFRRLPNSLQLMMVHSLQSEAFNRILAARLEGEMSLVEPVEGDVVAPVNENGKLDLSKVVIAETDTINRLARNCRSGRLAVTAALPGGHYALAEAEPGNIEHQVLKNMELDDEDWIVNKIPRLSSKGSRRPLTASFSDFSVEQATDVEVEQLSERWNNGPREGEQWHPDGCALRLRFTLPSGTYATMLMREFMRAPLTQY